MKKSKHVLIGIFLLVAGILISCNNQTENKPMTQEQKDYKFARIYIDDAVFDMMYPQCIKYDSIDTNAELTISDSTAWDCMAKLLTGEAEAIITPKEYTQYEDSIMNAYGVESHVKMRIAYDALTFFVKYDSPLDSLSVEQIEGLMFDKSKRFSDYFRNINKDYVFVTNSNLSSEAVNLEQLVLKNKKSKRRIFYFPSHDSVITFVKNYDAIGIGYLSQIIREPDLKPLRISYIDSAGNYIYPRAVHQANIVRKLYPYIVTHYMYVFSKDKEAAMRLGRYLSKHGDAQRYFLNYGIAPAFAQIKIIDEVN